MRTALPPPHQTPTASYTFERVLGRGGFATVYAGTMRTQNLTHTVAIKVLNPDATEQPEAVARLRDEALILSRLNHHAIVKVRAVFDIGLRPALAMELVDGPHLGTFIQNNPISPRAACELGAEVAAALDSAWNDPDPQTGRPLQVIHRDVKPQNILVSRSGVAKLTDFGVARAALERSGQTKSVHQFGTEPYMAPERFGDETSPKSDVFALGITIAECLRGAPVGQLPLLPRKFNEALEERLAPIRALPIDAAWRDQFLAVLLRTLSYDDAIRPTAAELSDLLFDLARTAPGGSLKQVARERLRSAVASSESVQPVFTPPKSSGTGPTSVDSIHRSPQANTPSTVSPGAPHTSHRSSAALFGAVAAGGLFALVALGAVVVGIQASRPDSPKTQRTTTGPVEPDIPSVFVSEDEPEPVKAEQADPPPAKPASRPTKKKPTSAPKPAKRTPTTPGPTPSTGSAGETPPPASPPPAEATPTPEAPPPTPEKRQPTGPPITIRFGATGAHAEGRVTVDGQSHNLPNRSGVALAPGTHKITFISSGGKSASKQIDVGPDQPKVYLWDTDSNTIVTR